MMDNAVTIKEALDIMANGNHIFNEAAFSMRNAPHDGDRLFDSTECEVSAGYLRSVQKYVEDSKKLIEKLEVK